MAQVYKKKILNKCYITTVPIEIKGKHKDLETKERGTDCGIGNKSIDLS